MPSADSGSGSSPFRCAAFPPVVRGMLADHIRGEHDVGEGTELPELLRGSAVLENDLVGIEDVDLAVAKVING